MTVINPSTATCPACLSGEDEPCFATSSDQMRAVPHKFRGLAAATTLRRCSVCEGGGWEPAVGPQPCPVCFVGPGEECKDTGAEKLRGRPHRVREVADAKGLRRCSGCDAVGWVPVDGE